METTIERFKDIFSEIQNTRIGLYGDFCLDAYWVLDPRGSEVSLETGLQASAVAKQYYTLGGASNVAANISALKPKELCVFGIYGDDVFGKEMISQLKEINVNTEGMIIQEKDFDTYTFSKSILEGKELPRIDFGTYNKRSEESDSKIIENIKKSIDDVDIFILNQQVPESITNQRFIDELNEVISSNPTKIFILDSRHFADKFKNVSYKANNFEAAQLSNYKLQDGEEIDNDKLKNIAEELYTKTNRPVFITRGENGILAYDENGISETDGLVISGELDIVGAGDTVISALACSLGSGSSIKEAIELANCAAGVTVQKLYQTGTANSEEIMVLINKYR